MIVSGGHILAIDGINTGVSVLGDGLRTPLEVNPEILEYYSAGPGIALHQGDEATEIENTDHIFYEVCSGTIDGTTMTVSAGHDRYCKLDVPSRITDLRIVVADTDDPTTVSKTMFEFTLPSDTKLSDVYVENTSGGECPLMGPMYWSGDVTYQGIVTNKIATIFGYSPNEELGPVISVDDGVPLDAGNGDHIVYNKSGIVGDGKRIYELDELNNLTIGTYVAVDEDDADSAQKFDLGKMKVEIYDAIQENEQAIVDLNDSLIDVSGELSDRIDSESDAIDAIGLEVDNLESTVSGHTTSISELQEDVEGIQSDISDLQEKDTQIERDIGNLSDSIEELDGRMTNDEDDIAAIAEVIPQDATSANKLVSESRLAQAIADFGGFEVVSLDPNTEEPDVQTPSEKIIYLTKDSQSTATDPYTEWIYRESEWQIIGDTTVDLSNYYTKTETDDLLDDKVDKEDGKGLSTNDFTDAYQTKLDEIETSAQKNVQSDWEESDVNSDAFIKNKPQSLSIVGGEGIAVEETPGQLEISVSGSYAETSAVDAALALKMDKSMSAEFYPMDTNPSGYLTSADLSEYATEDYVDNALDNKMDVVPVPGTGTFSLSVEGPSGTPYWSEWEEYVPPADPIQQVIITQYVNGDTLTIAPSTEPATLDHYEVNVYEE